LLQFVYAISNCLEKVETFVFGTRLTRITRQLGCGDADVALDQAIDSIQDWGGGTLARGMHTGLPCADDFLPVHNLASFWSSWASTGPCVPITAPNPTPDPLPSFLSIVKYTNQMVVGLSKASIATRRSRIAAFSYFPA
jgi:hypothetical protein